MEDGASALGARGVLPDGFHFIYPKGREKRAERGGPSTRAKVAVYARFMTDHALGDVES